MHLFYEPEDDIRMFSGDCFVSKPSEGGLFTLGEVRAGQRAARGGQADWAGDALRGGQAERAVGAVPAGATG